VITYSDSSKTTFTYDGEGKRLKKEESSGAIKYLYDQDKVILERDGADNALGSYTHEGGILYYDLISMRRSDASYYYLFDGLGSVAELVDSNENTQNTYRYEAFGQAKSSSENVTNPYRYVGAFGVHWDSTPALYFMQARYYMASVGRFISVDPYHGGAQNPMSLRRYVYCSNNPILFVDPRGLDWWPPWKWTWPPWKPWKPPKPVKPKPCPPKKERPACEKWAAGNANFCGDCCDEGSGDCLLKHPPGDVKAIACIHAAEVCNIGCSQSPQLDPRLPFVGL